MGGGAHTHTHIIRSLCFRIHPAPPPVRGILRKSEIQGPVSFASIKTPTWVNVEVLTPRPMTMQLHIADGRQLQARVPAGNAPYFHVRIPKRPNLFLPAQLPLTVEAARATGALPLVGVPGKKRKRGRRTNELRVCKHCRLLQRGRQDKKKVATTAVATPASTAQNRYRIQQYQAGALNQGAHMVPRRGSADHWCGLQPCSDSHKLYGPHFWEILRARLFKRPARNKSMDAFTKLSAHLLYSSEHWISIFLLLLLHERQEMLTYVMRHATGLQHPNTGFQIKFRTSPATAATHRMLVTRRTAHHGYSPASIYHLVHS